MVDIRQINGPLLHVCNNKYYTNTTVNRLYKYNCRPAAAAFLSDVAGTPNFSGHMQIDVINGKVSKFIAILVSVLRKVKLL